MVETKSITLHDVVLNECRGSIFILLQKVDDKGTLLTTQWKELGMQALTTAGATYYSCRYEAMNE